MPSAARSLLLALSLAVLMAMAAPAALADPPSLPFAPICGDAGDGPVITQCTDFTIIPEVQIYEVPGSGSVSLEFDFIFRGAILPNDLNAYVVDDSFGAVGGFLPGDPGYAAAARARAVQIFPPGATPSHPDVTVSFTGGDLVAFFINNGTWDFFSVDAANPDGLDHFVGFQSADVSQFGFEDLFGGGDLDYDDVLFNVDPPLPPAPAGLRYNEVRQKSSHNSYERDEALIDQLVFHRIRSIELDTHNDKAGHDPRVDDWLVYHGPQRGTTCNRLSDCLDELRAFHDANPLHEVVTVFVDLKDDWEDGRRPVNLDNRLTEPAHMGAGAILTPGDVRAACPSDANLREAVTNLGCGWPTLDSLRGKFIFVLTGETDRLDEYLTDGGAVAFIAPGVNSFSAATARDDVIFYNHRDFDGDLAEAINDAGLVSRFYDLNREDEFTDARDSVVHHLATDRVNFLRRGWARTHNELGWPFEPLDPADRAETDGFREVVRVISADVSSGDIWDKSDSFLYAYTFSDDALAPDTWSASISTPNSHVPNDRGKACLMARADTQPDAAYFAVCRLADRNQLQVQWREGDGDFGFTEADISPDDTVDEESLSFVRLRLWADGIRTCVAGDGGLSPAGAVGSPDDGYQLIDEHCFDEPLGLRGIASASRHKGRQITYVYTNLRGLGAAVLADDLDRRAAIGDRVTGEVFDGFSSEPKP